MSINRSIRRAADLVIALDQQGALGGRSRWPLGSGAGATASVSMIVTEAA